MQQNGGIRVVVADDHRPFRDALKQLLTLDDDIAVVGTACDGREAYELCLSLHPDVAVLDLLMPIMDGAQATREIKRDAPGVKVIILSVFNQEQQVRRGLEAGADRYLTKGLSRQELIAAVRAVARAGSQPLSDPTAVSTGAHAHGAGSLATIQMDRQAQADAAGRPDGRE